MRQRTQVEHWLDRVDQGREASIENAAVHLLDANAIAGDAANRMQHDKAGAAGLEECVGDGRATVFQPSFASA
jgi:hypothetical protein